MPTKAQEISKAYKEKQELLTNTEQQVLAQYYGFGLEVRHTLEEIGEGLGVSRERIRQIKAEALEKLGTPKRAPAPTKNKLKK